MVNLQNGAFAGMLTEHAPNINGWDVVAPDFTMAEGDNPNDLKVRKGVPVDEEIWLTRDDVANGEDTVVKRALEWIQEVTSLSESDDGLTPSGFSLEQNYPNPFNPITMINYQLPIASYVELSIYNLLVQKVATLVNENQQAGSQQLAWDATGFTSGVYYYHIKAGDFQDVKKMILLR